MSSGFNILNNLPFELLELINQSLDFKDTVNLMKCNKLLYSQFQKLLFNSNFIIYANLNKLPDHHSDENTKNHFITSQFSTSTIFHDDLNLIVIKDTAHLLTILDTLSRSSDLVKFIKSFKIHLVDLSIYNTNIHFQRSIGFSNQYNLVRKRHCIDSESHHTICKDGINLSFDVSSHSFQIQTRNIKKLYNFTLDTLIDQHRQLQESQHPKLYMHLDKPTTKSVNDAFNKRRKPVKSHEDFHVKAPTDSIILDLDKSIKRSFIFMPDDKTFPINDAQITQSIDCLKQEILTQFTKLFKFKCGTRAHNITNNWSFELIALNNAQIQSNIWNSYYYGDDHELEEGESRDMSQLSLKSFGLDIQLFKEEYDRAGNGRNCTNLFGETADYHSPRNLELQSC